MTRAEIDRGKPARAHRKDPCCSRRKRPPRCQGRSEKSRRRSCSKIQAGQRVRARNINPPGHTRLPRYARGKLGIVERDHGVFVFPDTNALFQGEKPQHVYSVRFRARILGRTGETERYVHIAMWDDYLEPV